MKYNHKLLAIACLLILPTVMQVNAQQITGTPVDDEDYQVPFKFTGKLDKLTIKIDRPQLTPADEQRLMEAERNNKTSE